MNPSVNVKEIKGFSQGSVTITIPIAINSKYFNSLKCPENGKNLDFHDPEICLAATVFVAVNYFKNKLIGTPKDNFSVRSPIILCEALGSKGIVITVVTSKSQTVLRKCCIMLAKFFTPDKLYSMYADLAKIRSTSTLGDKGKKGYSWASDQLVSSLKNVSILLTTTSNVDESNIKEMMISKFSAKLFNDGVKPTVEKEKEKDKEKEEGFEDIIVSINIKSGPSCVVIRHFLWEYKINSLYDGNKLWIFVPPSQWKTRVATLKTKKSQYVENKWSKLNDKIYPALLAMLVSSSLCTSSELVMLKDNVKAEDITELLNKLF